ncbi:MAG: GNAT family N-acetyltransferase [Pseudomonadaceae bacterium]|nr:GNAT family N-acetyltransferase [Pseudomonadaceae bacterium]
MIEILTLTPQQGCRLRDLRIAALADAPDAFGSTLDEALQKTPSQWKAEIASIQTFVAVEDTRDVGMVRAIRADTDEKSAYLISMWVAPDKRGRHVGEQLVRAVIEWAREAGFEQVLLDVADTNKAAIRLYSRMGFVPSGVVGNLPPPREYVKEHQRVLVLNTLTALKTD